MLVNQVNLGFRRPEMVIIMSKLTIELYVIVCDLYLGPLRHVYNFSEYFHY